MKKLVILLTTALVLQFIASCIHRNETPDSTNMDAIQMHIGETKGNYTIVDKTNSTIHFYSDGKYIGSTWALMSSNIGDGYTVSVKDMPANKKARTSGCGVYTVNKITPHSYNNEPCIHLLNAKGQVVSTALHGPAKGKTRGTRKDGGSAGCPRLPSGKLTSMVKSGFFHPGDTVIIIPEEKGNYIYFSHGEFHTVINNKQQADANPHLDIKYNDDPHLYHF